MVSAYSLENGNSPIFATTSYLSSEEKEVEFLRKLCEVMIIFLLPRGYSLSPLKNLLSEILAYKSKSATLKNILIWNSTIFFSVFYPIIGLITSPDYINQKIVHYIETRLAAAAINKRSYEYAASFEEFLKIINSTQSSDELVLIRTTIINDIMQATTMQNLQQAKGLDPDSEQSSHSKSELTAATKLKRYIQQLSYAKAQCEKNLGRLGWSGNFSNVLVSQ